jgi:hypothetical protein
MILGGITPMQELAIAISLLTELFPPAWRSVKDTPDQFGAIGL